MQVRIFSLSLFREYSHYIMPRRRKPRKIVTPPRFHGYRPYRRHRGRGSHDLGNFEPSLINDHITNETIELLYEEYEALKLADYDMLTHQEASVIMGVSRATFARIYESARRKIAKAFVETKEIVTVFGNAVVDNNWHTCMECSTKFSLTTDFSNPICPICGSKEINAPFS